MAIADGPALVSSLAPPFAALAAKNPQLSAYRAATSDLLRWRARAATSQAKGARKSFSELPTGPLVPESAGELVPATVKTVATELVDKKASFANFVGVKDHGATGPMVNFGYPHLAAADTGKALAQLKTDLLIDTGGKPETLEAVLAVEALSRGDVAEVGGVVSGIEIDGLIPLCANPRDDAWGLVRLGPLEKASPKLKPIEQLRARIDIEPKWLRTEHYFTELP